MKGRVLLCVGLVGCHGARPADAEVDHLVATDPPVISWAPPEARSVEVHHAPSGRVMWRVHAGGGLRGVDPVRSPLTYGEAARPAGVNPPDNAGTQSVVGPEPLAPAERYRVTIDRCLTDASPRPCELVVTFTTSNTIPMTP